MARELCYSSEPCWSAEWWNCIWKSQSNYWGCQGKKLCDNIHNIWAKYAPRSINVRLRLKLMSMSRFTNGCFCLFRTDFTKKKKNVILRSRRPLILSTNRYTKSRRWLKSWQERYRQVTWNKWSIMWFQTDWERYRKGLPICLSSPWCVCKKSKTGENQGCIGKTHGASWWKTVLETLKRY